MTKNRNMQISITAVLLPLMLIFAMFTALGCDLFGGMDTKALEAAIKEAKSLQQGTVPAPNGDSTPKNAFWATSANKATLQTAITAAEAVLASGTTQEEIDGATSTLRAAINVFTSEHRKPGTKPDDPNENTKNIRGTITLTNIPATNRPKVSIQANLDGAGRSLSFDFESYDSGSYNSEMSEISLSGVTGPEAELNWSIPVSENEYVPEYVFFSLYITPAGTTSSLRIDLENNSSYGVIDIPEDRDVGDLGTYSIGTVVLSGTINVNVGGDLVPRVQIRAYSYTEDLYSSIGYVELTSPAADAPWTMVIPSYPDQHSLYFTIMCLRSNWAELFQDVYVPNPPILAQNSNIPGINIDLGPISRGDKLGDLSGTITLTDIKNPKQTVYIDTYYNSSMIDLSGVSDTQATLNWSVPIYENDYYFDSANITLEVLESGSSKSFTIYLGDYYFDLDTLDTPIDLGTVSLWNPEVPRNTTPLTANTWVNGEIGDNGGIDWYTISVTSGTYYLWWNDDWEGNGTKTADIFVDVYRGTPENLTMIWSNEDSAWSSPLSFTANSTGTVYVRVTPYDSGTYGIVYSTANTRPAL